MQEGSLAITKREDDIRMLRLQVRASLKHGALSPSNITFGLAKCMGWKNNFVLFDK